MKILFLLLCIPFAMQAQKIALVDREFKSPIIFMDSVAHAETYQDRFPIYINDMDVVLKTTERLARYINTGRQHDAGEQSFTTGKSRFLAQTEKTGHSNRYRIIINTRTGSMGTSLTLVNQDDGQRKAVQKLNIFVDYLKNNLSALAEVTPH
jgi:hypothetical protein